MASFPQASLTVLAPSGQKTRAVIRPIPFIIGRQSDSDLVLRDNRASRKHARILFEGGAYVVEDLDSRHGVWINGQRVHRQVLREADRIDLGLNDSYSLIFTREKDRFRKVLSHVSSFLRPDARTGDLAKLRSLVEVARALENSLSTEEVLAAVVDAALTVTGCERGFLLLRGANIGELEIAVARDRAGRNLPQDALQVPVARLWNLLATRRELLSMPFENSAGRAQQGYVLCLPLVRLRSESAEETRATTTQEETVGVIYLDSDEAADLSSGGRELLETLAIEASTILENAHLLEEQRSKIRMEDELRIAREIQRGLQPVSFPASGWFRAMGSSKPSHEVGGDYYDVHSIPGISGNTPDVWTIVMADVSGKGVSSALLASLLQGAFLMASGDASRIAPRMSQLNEFLLERTKGEKYVTVFYGVLDSSGLLSYTNAGQCSPVLVKADGRMATWEPTSMPVGMIEGATFQMIQEQLSPGDKVVLYTDGVTEAESAAGEFFGGPRLREIIRENATRNATELHAGISGAVERFMQPAGSGEGGRMEDTDDGAARDDITLLVIEYAGRV